MTDYANQVTRASESLDDISLVLHQLEYALTKQTERAEELTRIISGQELTIDSLRRIVIGLGHQSMLNEVVS